MALVAHSGEHSVMAKRQTRGAHRGRALLAGIMLLAMPIGAPAQGIVRAVDARVGSEEERYLRALSLLSAEDHPTRASGGARRTRSVVPLWSIRPIAAERLIRALATTDGPWQADTVHEPDGARLAGADADVTFNSGLPSTTPDGPAWNGRGMNARLAPVARVKRSRWNLQVAPMLWLAQNSAFDLAPTSGPFPWSDPAAPRSVDLPQRFGDESVARLDPGESFIAFDWRHARLALTSAAAHLGPGPEHALLLQGNAGGIPRLEVATPRGLETRIGTFGAVAGWGRTPHTAWAPDRRTGALYSSFIGGTWRPRLLDDRFEVGMVRLTHRDWERMTALELLVPFGSVYSAAGGSYGTETDNQLASVFASVRVPESGLEFFGEFGKNDRSAGWRDQLQELEHNSAWLLGAQKVWRDDRRRLWSVVITTVSGAIAPIDSFRGQAFFYEHGVMTQGHTLRGQLLGTPLMQREGGGELRLDRWDRNGRVGLLLGTRALPNELAESIAPENVRQEWSAMVDVMRWTRTGAWRARLGAIADIGHSPARDAYSLHLAFGYSRRRVTAPEPRE
jgi:hypothetical protein